MLVVYSRQNSLLLKNINRNTGSVVRNYPNARIKRNILLQSYFLFLIVQQKFLVFFRSVNSHFWDSRYLTHFPDSASLLSEITFQKYVPEGHFSVFIEVIKSVIRTLWISLPLMSYTSIWESGTVVRIFNWLLPGVGKGYSDL